MLFLPLAGTRYVPPRSIGLSSPTEAYFRSFVHLNPSKRRNRRLGAPPRTDGRTRRTSLYRSAQPTVRMQGKRTEEQQKEAKSVGARGKNGERGRRSAQGDRGQRGVGGFGRRPPNKPSRQTNNRLSRVKKTKQSSSYAPHGNAPCFLSRFSSSPSFWTRSSVGLSAVALCRRSPFPQPTPSNPPTRRTTRRGVRWGSSQGRIGDP